MSFHLWARSKPHRSTNFITTALVSLFNVDYQYLRSIKSYFFIIFMEQIQQLYLIPFINFQEDLSICYQWHLLQRLYQLITRHIFLLMRLYLPIIESQLLFLIHHIRIYCFWWEGFHEGRNCYFFHGVWFLNLINWK